MCAYVGGKPLIFIPPYANAFSIVIFGFVWMYNKTLTQDWLCGIQRVFFPLDLSVVLFFTSGTSRVSENQNSLSPVEPDIKCLLPLLLYFTKVVTKKFTANWSLGWPFLVLSFSGTFPTISPFFMSVMGTVAITSAFFRALGQYCFREKNCTQQCYSFTNLLSLRSGYFHFLRPLYVHSYSYITFKALFE